METEWRIERSQLRELIRENPKISHEEAARQLGHSVTWVCKWQERFKTNDNEETAINSLSHRPKHIPIQVPMLVEERIVALRVGLSAQYNRTVGPRTIATYLKREKEQLPGLVPTSSATIWRILRKRQYILSAIHEEKQPFERPDPGLDWEVDYCTAANHSPEAPEKQRNALEVFNVVDRGDSSCVSSHAATNFDAENTLLEVASTLQQHGIPRCVICDRDPRLVGSQSADNYPSAFLRFLSCLGCAVDILPPRRPDLKPYVERFQRTLKTECIQKHQPETAAAANECLKPYCEWYNLERPHQGDVNRDQPPLQPARRASRPRVPERVDPDRWLNDFHGRSYRRHVDSRGAIRLWKQTYYIGKAFKNQTVRIRLDAATKSIQAEIAGQLNKQIPLKGLYGREMEYLDFLAIMGDEARSEWKTYLREQYFKAQKASAATKT